MTEQSQLGGKVVRLATRRPAPYYGGTSKLGRGELPMQKLGDFDVEIELALELGSMLEMLGGEIYYKTSYFFSDQGRSDTLSVFTTRGELPKLISRFRVLARLENAEINVRKPLGISAKELQLEEGELAE